MFFTGLVFLSTLMDVNSLSCNINEQSRINNQDHKLLMLLVKSLSFFPIVLKLTNVVVVPTISIIYMQNCVFLMLLKI